MILMTDRFASYTNGSKTLSRVRTIRRTCVFALPLCILALSVSCGSKETAQHSRASIERTVHTAPGLAPDSALAAEVKEAFLHAWRGYERYAWGRDALKPLSRAGRDWYDSSLLMTPVDAYDTMLLMGLDEEAARARKLVFEHLAFDRDMTVQVFEVTIRLLGAMLTAYQMDGDPRWLEMATDLADRLMPAFDSPTRMPYVRVNLVTGAVEEPHNNPAEIGTLTLEFGQLSHLTGEARYFDAVKTAVTELYTRRSDIGLVGTVIDVETGQWLDPASHVGGRIDSFYEYLLKASQLFEDNDFRTMWETSRRALDTYVADDVPGSGLWYGVVDMNTGQRTATTFGALHAFLPAVQALGGDLDRAHRLMDSVYSMWTRFEVEPELFDYRSGEILYPSYPLRPEALESAYYLFVLTGDERYRSMGRDILRRIVRWTRVEDGFAHLKDVRTKEKNDAMESFFLAETLKYAYLLARPDVLDFDGVVFNTEAHPLRPVAR
jgi:mannosidase alpha-like ER degradation enhancer 2